MTSQADNKKTQGKSAAAYLLLPLALAGLLAMLGAAAYPAAGELPAQKLPATAKAAGRAHAIDLPASAAMAATAAVPNSSQDLDSRLKELEATQKALYSSWLDGQRKTIDWWLAFLAIMMGVLALAGVAIPYLMGRKDKELMNQLLQDARQMATETQQQFDEIKAAAVDAKRHRDATQENAEESGRILRAATSGQEQTPEKKSELAAAAKHVKEDTQASQSDKLRAEAVQAATQNNADKAHILWAAVVALEPTDHVAHANAGYWAQMQAEKETETPQRSRFWLQEAARAYAQALQIKPDMHAAANNWGAALAAEAKALTASDLPAARALWLQAGQHYAQALQIKPDKHEAANNWGNALAAEAQALAGNDLPAARALWLQAGQHYAQALQIKHDKHEAANNWGSALDDEAKALTASDLPAARALWQQAGQHYAQALQIKPDMHDAANNWGNALNVEAQALAGSDLPAARALWLQAGQHYAQALQIKPDKHEAANNWGAALATEAQALAVSDLPAARALWLQAGQHYAQALQIKPDKHEAANNWGSALDDEAKALTASDLPAARALWLQAGQHYARALQIKPDMHAAASNWGAALLHEWSALVATDANAASEILERALTLLQSHAQSAPAVVAYNLACCFALKGDVPQALKWLECSAMEGTLPAKSNIQTDKDFDGIRDDSRFIAWVNKLEK